MLFRKELKFYNNFQNTATTKIVVCPEFSIASKRQQGTVGQTVFIFGEFQVYRLDRSKSSVARFVSIPRHELSFISNFKFPAYEKTNELLHDVLQYYRILCVQHIRQSERLVIVVFFSSSLTQIYFFSYKWSVLLLLIDNNRRIIRIIVTVFA